METCHLLKVRSEEHQKGIVRREKTEVYQPFWNEVKIIGREQHWKIRKLKNSAHMLGHYNLLSRPRIEIGAIWKLVIRKERAV